MRRGPVIDEVTAEPASGEPSGATGEPSSGSGKKPAVKKMPKRPAAKLMPRKKLLKVKSETASGTRQVVRGKDLFKNRETKRRQKEKLIKIRKSAKEERAMPAPAFEIPSVGGTGPVKRFFDPASGHRQTVEEDIGFVALAQVFPGTPLRSALAVNAVRKGT